MALENENLYLDLQKMIGEEVIIITKSVQLNLLGQVFRPIFTGVISEAHQGHLTLSPIIIKMVNAPFYKFPFPLSIPYEQIVSYSFEVPSDLVFPLS